MAAEHRRVIAESTDRARALAENLGKRGFAIIDQRPNQWTLRKHRWRGDITVTIAIKHASPAALPPPTGPRYG